MNETKRFDLGKFLNPFQRKPKEVFECFCVDQIIEQYRTIPNEYIDEEGKKIFNDLLEHKRNKRITISDRYAAENALLKALPLEQLRRTAWIQRARYKNTAGDALYSQYLKSNPPDPKSASEQELRSDLMQLLSEMQRIETFRKAVERSRYSIAAKISYLTLALFLISTLVLFLKTRFFPESNKFVITPIMVVSAVGALGGCLGTLQRLLSSSIKSEAEDLIFEFQQAGTSFLVLPPIIGLVFAAALYLMFAAGFVQGDLFPSIVTDTDVSKEQIQKAVDLNNQKTLNFLLNTYPKGGADYAIDIRISNAI